MLGLGALTLVAHFGNVSFKRLSLLLLPLLIVTGLALPSANVSQAAPRTSRSVSGEVGHRNATIEGDPRLQVISSKLNAVSNKQGIPAALDLLDKLTVSEKLIPQFTHLLSHDMAKTSMGTYYTDHQLALAACDMRYQFGCTHGVLEAYFEQGPPLDVDRINDVCGSTKNMTDAQVVMAQQCAHGLGHAIMDANEHRIFDSVPMCDPLDREIMIIQCRIAIFMANNIQMTDQMRIASGSLKPDAHSAHPSYWKRDDLNYPCSAFVNDAYTADCYVMLPAGLIDYLRSDMDAVARACDQAEEKWRTRCHITFGREMVAREGYDARKGYAICLRINPLYRGTCVAGAAQNLTSVNQKVEEAQPLCHLVDAAYKKDCYRSIGVTMRDFYPTDESRVKACSLSEAAYVDECLQGVRTGRRN